MLAKKIEWFVLNVIVIFFIVYEHCHIFLNHAKLFRIKLRIVGQKSMFKHISLKFFKSFFEKANQLNHLIFTTIFQLTSQTSPHSNSVKRGENNDTNFMIFHQFHHQSSSFLQLTSILTSISSSSVSSEQQTLSNLFKYNEILKVVYRFIKIMKAQSFQAISTSAIRIFFKITAVKRKIVIVKTNDEILTSIQSKTSKKRSVKFTIKLTNIKIIQLRLTKKIKISGPFFDLEKRVLAVNNQKHVKEVNKWFQSQSNSFFLKPQFFPN